MVFVLEYKSFVYGPVLLYLNKRNLFMKKFFSFLNTHQHPVIGILAVALCSLLLFTSLDDKIYDLFLRAIPTLTENPAILIVKVDDVSIEKVGHFPWSRDILADAIIFLREMGADTVVFDLSYLDRSPLKVDPNYMETQLPLMLKREFSALDDNITQVMRVFASGRLKSADAEMYGQELTRLSAAVQERVSASLSLIARDVDSYFARALRLFGNSFLTLTMITPESVSDVAGADFSSPYDSDLASRVALKNVISKNDTLTPARLGILPALPLLLEQSKGAGFVNAPVDVDGYRRRVHLLERYRGDYYAQLVFYPLLQRLGNPSIEVNNSAITLKNASVDNQNRTIIIPRSRDGSILIQWPRKQFLEYNTLSTWNLIAASVIEEKLLSNLTLMEDSNFFEYTAEGLSPLDNYRLASDLRTLLLEGGEQPDEGLTFESWTAIRTAFFDSLETLLSEDAENTLLSGIDASETEIRDYVQTMYSVSRSQYKELSKLRDNARQRAAGAFCIIGEDVTSITDNGLTTFEEQFPNVGIHSTIANMILAQEFLDDTPYVIIILTALLLSVGLALLIKRMGTGHALVAGAIGIVLTVSCSVLFFIITRRYPGMIVQLSSVALTFSSLSVRNFLKTLKEKAFLRNAFSRYLSPAVINEIIADPTKLNLGGEKREMTAIFTDIRGFSTISEQLDPADLVKLLNIYLTAMSDIVLENQGTIDKYEGDAIIAFFGAPIHMHEHAALACRTAIRMKQAEAVLNERFLHEGLSPVPLFTRIGLNSGDMIVGNMGTPNKMDYTIMGNAVNLAARLEGVNKQYDTRGILISEYTRSRIGTEFLLRRIDRVRVVGISTPLQLFELIGLSAETPTAVAERTALWEEAITAFQNGDFSGARRVFQTINQSDPEDGTARLYIERCSSNILNPPPSEWDGVFNLTQK